MGGGKLKNKNAFTLIELLAIIVILAIIAVITVPIILNIIENSRKGAAIDSAYGYKDSINKYYLSRMMNDKNFIIDGTYTINENGEMVKGSDTLTIPVSGQKPTGGEITYELQNIKEGCLTINGYKIIFNGNNVESASKGICYEQTTITFDLNYNNQKDEQSKNIDKKIGTLPNPSRTNYALQGWFTEATGGTQINADTMVTGQTTYYAHWVQNAVSVTFDSRGGSAITQTTVQMNHSYNQDHIQLPETTREGYTFLGWFETQEGGTAITGNETLTTDKTYYAQWEEQTQTYTVTFVDYDNNSTVYTSQNVNEEELATEPQEPTKNNYVFAGWYDQYDNFWDFSSSVYEDTTIYAKFIPLSAFECPGDNCVYSYYTQQSSIGSSIPDEFCDDEYASYHVCGSDYTAFYYDDSNTQLRNFLGHKLNNNEITDIYVCGIYDGINGERTFCLLGLYDGITAGGLGYANRNFLKTVFAPSECSLDDYDVYGCYDGTISAEISEYYMKIDTLDASIFWMDYCSLNGSGSNVSAYCNNS